jgi:hypothetical protein
MGWDGMDEGGGGGLVKMLIVGMWGVILGKANARRIMYPHG